MQVRGSSLRIEQQEKSTKFVIGLIGNRDFLMGLECVPKECGGGRMKDFLETMRILPICHSLYSFASNPDVVAEVPFDRFPQDAALGCRNLI
jgi:hypothetical protein